jgi:hypothetical protein
MEPFKGREASSGFADSGIASGFEAYDATALSGLKLVGLFTRRIVVNFHLPGDHCYLTYEKQGGI